MKLLQRGLLVILSFLASVISTMSYAQTPLEATTIIELIIKPHCLFNGSSNVSGINLGQMDFGTHISLVNPITTNTNSNANSLRVRCTPGTALNISISNGSYFSSPNRRMKRDGSSTYVNYNIYTNADHSTVWNNTNIVSHTFINNDEMFFPLYAKVPALSASPSAGQYKDTVTVNFQF